ncbi:MAG: hypothetical protein NC341_12820 [Blautia sp.]|nr:hypothetical protein [Blautia sp.]MCM1202307.1 hypothetical protein [Bacteroides fragilis]
MYQKEIIYLALFHEQVKEKNAGYFKVDRKADAYRLELHVKNISGAIAGNFPIRLQSETGWQEAGTLFVKEGSGKWNGSAAEPVLRVEVILSDVQKIKGESRLLKAGETEPKEPVAPARRKEAEPLKERQEEAPARAPQPEEPVKSVLRQDASAAPAPHLEEPEKPILHAESMSSSGQQSSMPAWPAIREERISVKPEHMPLYENKWEQLLTTYEQIHPYGDNRIYVKLAPKDFIILRENYQHLVNNSFLLHGFYNYRYLILGKEKDFYLGVPGVFYEREKMVALMFGFEAFECEGSSAEEGKFGYYLRKVEL